MDDVEKTGKEKEEITVAEVMKEIKGDIDSLQTNLDHKFDSLRESLLVAKPKKDYFLCKNKFWDSWLQKLLSQMISVKLWIIVLITVLLGIGLITNIQFAAILGIIMGMKGVFSAASVWKNKDTDRSMVEKV